MTFDLRTRVDGSEQHVEPTTFFGQTLPLAFDRTHELLAPSLEYRPPSPLTIRIESQEWTLRAVGSSIVIDRSGTVGTRHLQLHPRELTDLVHDQVTPNGWFTRGSLRSSAPLSHVLDWWLLIRGAIDGTAPYVAGSIPLLDADGSPLQLTRSFTLDDSPGDMRHFLGEAGFLHIRNVFTDAEIAAVSRDMDRLAALYTPADGRSFWGRVTTGEDRLVRMQYFDTVSERAAAVVGDTRVRAIVNLTGDGHVPNTEAGLVEALFKPVGMVGRIADFPWHKDCSLGRHSYECCSLTIGLSITHADDARGQLRMVAGSHRALMWPVLNQPGVDLPIVDLSANPGDVTIHLSCTMHMSQPPLQGERRVLYVGFRLPERDAAAASIGRRRSGLRTWDLA